MGFIESRIEKTLQSHDSLSCAGFVALANLRDIPISRPVLSNALNGLRPLGNKMALQLDGLVSEIEKLVESIRPVPISFRNPARIALLLRDDKNSETKIPSMSQLILARHFMQGLAADAVAQERGISVESLREELTWVYLQLLKMTDDMYSFVFEKQ